MPKAHSQGVEDAQPAHLHEKLAGISRESLLSEVGVERDTVVKDGL